MRRPTVIIGLLFLGLVLAPRAEAALTYHDRHFLFTIAPPAAWNGGETLLTYEGFPIDVPAGVLSGTGTLPPGVVRQTSTGWNREAIATTIRTEIAAEYDREAGAVTISRSSGAVVFDGVGMPGQKVDIEAAVELTIAALEGGADRVTLPMIATPPTVTVNDPELRAQGITELVTIGESDYSNSPVNRVHNINVGLKRFNGHIIPK
ncbi:MAG: hypothetical protein KBC95_03860, partial [Candidatus Peribacteraceae bacterium]|nr:hypothetical protein [Candidatus Peribacteraceae bacterium]